MKQNRAKLNARMAQLADALWANNGSLTLAQTITLAAVLDLAMKNEVWNAAEFRREYGDLVCNELQALATPDDEA